MTEWAIAFGSSLGGALVGGGIVTWLTQALSNKSERRRMRRDVLRALAGHRYRLTDKFAECDGEFWVALNEIPVAYLDDAEVMEALRVFRDKVNSGFRAEDLTPLMRKMAHAAGLPSDSLESAEIEHPFTPRSPRT